MAILLALILVTVSVSYLQAQNFDHEPYPKLDFDLTHLELDLGLQPQNLNIDGAATFQLEANVSGADTVILYAARLDISSVTVDDQQVDFSLQNDSLFIPLNQPSEAGESHEVYVRYSGSPTFGLLKNRNGTIWTSQLPKSQRHWVPIIDNPHESLEFELNVSVPSGYTVLSSGRLTGKEAASVEVMTYQFATEEAIPASGLSFSVGRYANGSDSGDRRVAVSVEQALVDSVDAQSLLQTAADQLQQIENELEVEYPYSDLDVIVMEDHNWEMKTWGASTIFLYENMGDLQTQLLRGMLGQWYGIYQRETQWQESDIITLHQVMTQQTLSYTPELLMPEDIPMDTTGTLYDSFSPQTWNSWQEGLSEWQGEAIASDLKEEALQELPQVVSWDDYARYWYRKSGQPLFESPTFSFQNDEPSTGGETDSVYYRVNYILNETEDQLTLNFTAAEGEYNKLTSLEGYEVYTNKTDTSEVTFTGAEDSIVLQVSPMINTFYLSPPEGVKLHLEEHKPVNFLLYELRNAETVEQQAKAARKLGKHSDNADLQLAIRDYLNKDNEPSVQAALLRSLGEITQGAAGTETTFLKALDNPNRKIREAALMSLQHYPETPSVVRRVEQLALNTERRETFEKATQVLTTLTSAEEFDSFAQTVLQQDSVGYRAIFAVQEMANMGAVEEAVDIASNFLNEEYSYEIRSRGLQILRQHDASPQSWLERAERLFTDPDPRMRYLFAQALRQNLNQELTQYLKEHIQDEYDARVYREISRLLK